MIDIIDTSGNHMYDIIGKSDYTYPGQWYALGGDYNIPTNATSVRFYVQIPQEGVDYLADDAELTLIPSISAFSTDVDKQIDKLRKADLSISLEGSNPSNLEIEVQQTRSKFGWGSAVNVHYLSNSKYANYRKFYYDLFEWGVLENALKWQYLEKTQGSFKPDAALGAVNDLLSNGIKVRGHNIFWDAGKYVPVWQKSLSPVGIKQSLEQHIKDMTSTFRGKFQQWDVNNENVHLKFYEGRLNDPNITAWMIREVHRMDPITECYLNDYGVVANKYETMAYVNQAVHLKESGVPVVGMGIQSHLHNLVDVSIIKVV
ncbi:uncharacterized protein LOC126821937 [Patella vulgata]|uniref:uncharacterized protein LOC126821937 n=1 Tax=Patella vulgata TaxID=6465 RepID=UPI0024A8411E|nr:uncharacterized protein LOC126821937 [Patella vulgata]